MIFPVWQSLGQSTHALAQRAAQLTGEKATHTGTLDPMAEGVVVILTGEGRFAKGSLDWQKTYRFSILWGVQTDSLDQLGLISTVANTSPGIERIQQAAQAFPSAYLQTTPAFSALRHQGKSGFELARAELPIPLKKRAVHVGQISVESWQHISGADLLAQHEEHISHVHGDFRQSMIAENWQNTLPKRHDFLVSSHRVTATPGTYIRQLVQDLAASVNLTATTWSITREKNGPYEQQDCIDEEELRELFTG